MTPPSTAMKTLPVGRMCKPQPADADQHRSRDDRADGGDGAHRNVEGAGDDHHGLADGHQPDDHDRLGQAVHQVLPGEKLIASLKSEPAAHHGDEENQHDQGEDQREVVGANKSEDGTPGAFRLCAGLGLVLGLGSQFVVHTGVLSWELVVDGATDR